MTVLNKKLKSEYGFETTGFVVSNGLLRSNAAEVGDLVINGDLEFGGTQNLSVVNGVVVIDSTTTGTMNNVSIGAITPAVGKFTNLIVLNNATFDLTGSILIDATTTGSIDNVNIGISTPGNAQFLSVTATTGTITNLSGNTATITSITSTGTQTLGNVTANNVTVNNNLTVSNDITADNLTLNNDPTVPNHATRKSYVDATVAALAIALGG